jgi:hypothetical protein
VAKPRASRQQCPAAAAGNGVLLQTAATRGVPANHVLICVDLLRMPASCSVHAAACCCTASCNFQTYVNPAAIMRSKLPVLFTPVCTAAEACFAGMHANVNGDLTSAIAASAVSRDLDGERQKSFWLLHSGKTEDGQFGSIAVQPAERCSSPAGEHETHEVAAVCYG